jgi:hypothetical protein
MGIPWLFDVGNNHGGRYRERRESNSFANPVCQIVYKAVGGVLTMPDNNAEYPRVELRLGLIASDSERHNRGGQHILPDERSS